MYKTKSDCTEDFDDADVISISASLISDTPLGHRSKVSVKRFKGDLDYSENGDSVLSCLQSIVQKKESFAKDMFVKAASKDDFGPDVGYEFSSIDGSFIDSSCEIWLNLRKL